MAKESLLTCNWKFVLAERLVRKKFRNGHGFLKPSCLADLLEIIGPKLNDMPRDHHHN
jgi:hypothetical protein